MTTTYENPLHNLYQAHGQFINFLKDNSSTFGSANTYAAAATSNLQNGVNNISIPNMQTNAFVQAEIDRLNDKKTSIDAEWNTRQRLVTLSQNTLKRNQQYNNIVALVFVALLVILVFQWFVYPMGLLPAALVDLILVFIVSFLVIWILYIAYDVSRRDNMDYDSINLGKFVKPNAALTLQEARANARNGIIGTTTAGGSCQGPSCCQDGTYWAVAAGQCVPKGYDATHVYSLNGNGDDSTSPAFVTIEAATGKCGGKNTYFVQSAAKCLPIPTSGGGSYSIETKTHTCTTGTYDPATNTCVSDQAGTSAVSQGFHTMFGMNADGSSFSGSSGDPQSNSGYEFQNYSSYRK